MSDVIEEAIRSLIKLMPMDDRVKTLTKVLDCDSTYLPRYSVQKVPHPSETPRYSNYPYGFPTVEVEATALSLLPHRVWSGE